VGGREEHLEATWDLSAAGCFLYIMTADMALPNEITVRVCSLKGNSTGGDMKMY